MKQSFRSTLFRPGGQQGFLDRSVVIRILIGIFFFLVLLGFVHYRQVQFEMLDLNSEANRYVVAQVNFEYPDQERTAVLRQEALRDVGTIYRLNSQEMTHRQAAFERQLTEDQKWRAAAPQATYEEMYQGVDQLGLILAQSRFTDPRTLKKIRALGLPADNYFVYVPPETGEATSIPEEIWDEIGDRAFFNTELRSAAISFIADHFEKEEWSLEDDPAAVQMVRNLIKKTVPPVTTHVKAGHRIIDKGDRVSSGHISMLQAMNDEMAAQRNLWNPFTVIGSILIALLFTLIVSVYLYFFHPKVYFSNKRLFLLTLIILITFVIAKVVEFFVVRSTSTMIEAIRYPLFVPFAAIILCSLLNPRIAITTSGFLAIIMSVTLAVEPAEFLVINLLAALVAILSTGRMRQRKEVFLVCGKAWLACIVMVVGFHLYTNSFLSWSVISDIATTLIFMIVTAVLVVGILPLLESSFRIVTGITLIEYMDPTHPLLRRLSVEAPGTYQHSILVGNISETAALAIDADGLFCRAATLYHDIGKLINPQYFTENQQGGISPHQLLTPLESAQAIMAHVPDGVTIARKHNIPEPFIDIIKEHHGNTLVYYFYHKAVELAGGDQNEIEQSTFRYAGPKPKSKESAIIMIADTVEAASRSMEELTEESVTELIEQLVRGKTEDGQFDECRLTFAELGIVKRSLVQSVLNARHTRVKYPSKMPPAGLADDPAILPDEHPA